MSAPLVVAALVAWFWLGVQTLFFWLWIDGRRLSPLGDAIVNLFKLMTFPLFFSGVAYVCVHCAVRQALKK